MLLEGFWRIYTLARTGTLTEGMDGGTLAGFSACMGKWSPALRPPRFDDHSITGRSRLKTVVPAI